MLKEDITVALLSLTSNVQLIKGYNLSSVMQVAVFSLIFASHGEFCTTISCYPFIYLFMALVDNQCRENILRFLYSEMTFLELPIYF